MRFVIASDTHGRTDKLIELQMKEPADRYLFAGDLCDEPKVAGPWAMVQGNNDHYLGSTLPKAIVIDAGKHKILMTHGHLQGYYDRTKKLAKLARDNGCDILVYGHTHRPEITEQDGVLILNPGSLSRPRSPLGCTYMTLDIDDDKVDPQIVQEK